MSRTDVTADYSPLIAWFYDKVAADAVVEAMAGLCDRIAGAAGPAGAVLDVGCGAGQFASWLVKNHPGLRVTGVDLSPHQVRRAEKRSDARLRFQRASAEDLPFPDDSFDVVYSIASIKHWRDRANGLAELVRVLKPGGLLLVTELDRACTLADARDFTRTLRLPAPARTPYLWMFRTYITGQSIDLEEARQLVSRIPLTDREVTRMPGAPFVMFSGVKQPGPRH